MPRAEEAPNVLLPPILRLPSTTTDLDVPPVNPCCEHSFCSISLAGLLKLMQKVQADSVERGCYSSCLRARA